MQYVRLLDMSRLKSIFAYTCPRCRQSKLFKEPFQVAKPVDMNVSCETCGQRFEPEPGFYYGAMFISYIISGFTFIGVALTLVFVFAWSVEAAMGVVIVIAVLGFFKLLRISRSLWIHFVVPFEPHKANGIPE